MKGIFIVRYITEKNIYIQFMPKITDHTNLTLTLTPKPNQKQTNMTDTDGYQFDKKALKQNDIDVVLYHGYCPDGFTSATACWHYRKKNGLSNEPEDIVYHGMAHGRDTWRCPPGIEDKNVLICDFSFSEKVMLEMIGKAKNVLVLDHHKTAKAALANIPEENKVFDMDHSGAYITWRYFFGYNVQVPSFVLYVEDHDIWTRVLPDSDAYSYLLRTVEFEFDTYEQFFDEKYFASMRPVAKGCETFANSMVERIVDSAVPHFMLIKGKYYFAAHVDTSVLKSEVGNKVFEKLPLTDFSVVRDSKRWSGTTSFSMRSENSRVDVSEIARCFGGGGHRNAAGASALCTTQTLPGQILDKYRVYYHLKTLRPIKIGVFTGVAICAPLFGKHLVNYFMQDRTPGVQNADFVLRNREERPLRRKTVYDFALEHHPSENGNENHIDGSLLLGSHLNEIEKKKITEAFRGSLDLAPNGFGSFSGLGRHFFNL